MKKIKIIAVIFFLLFNDVFAEQNKANVMDLQNISIQSALHVLAERLKMNVNVSPAVQGSTSLHLEDMSTAMAFDNILATHHLKMWRVKQTWYIATMDEYMSYKESEVKRDMLEEEASPLETVMWQIRYAKAADIASMIENNKHSLLSKRGYLTVDVRTNVICIRDTRKTIDTIQRFIRKIDVPVQQVLIEAKLASIDSNYERDLGFHFSQIPAQGTGEVRSLVKSNASGYSFAVLSLPDGSKLNWELSALERSGHGELISSPSLVAANQQTAVIESGEEIPYQESTSSGATAVTFKKAVLSLKVTPQIMPDNNILLELKVNQDKPSKRTVLGVPSINTRQMTTNIQLKNGQTVVLGGIYEINHEVNEEQTPFLATIPVLGWLFREQNKIKNKRELLIFVTPKIIH